MPIAFEIFPRRGLVVVEYSGTALIDETARVFAVYARHPDAVAGQKHLVDLSRVTDVENDMPRLMALQARHAGEPARSVLPALLVFLAPTPLARRMADMVSRSWTGLGGPVIAILETEAEALAVVGCAETRLADLRRQVAGA